MALLAYVFQNGDSERLGLALRILIFTEKLHQRWFPPSVPSCPPHQAAQAGLHHQDPPVDIRAVFQGLTSISLTK